MPQGRRKTPFSGKAKKEQLKAKKQKSDSRATYSKNRSNILLKQTSDDEQSNNVNIVQKINYQPSKSGQNSNRYALQFYKESKEEMQIRREQARQPIEGNSSQIVIQIDDYFLPGLDFPKRPTWSYNERKEVLLAKENRYFMEYQKDLDEKFNLKEFSYFELNLETWRQLWRVLEMSDIVLIIADIRFPALQFPPLLYKHVTQVLRKHMILVLNKIDLCPTPLVAAWRNYFLQKYPELKVLMFTNLPTYNLVKQQQNKSGLQIRKRKGRMKMAAEGTQLLLEACKEIVGDEVDLSSWEKKISEECQAEFQEDDRLEIGETIEPKQHDDSFYEHELYKNGVLTIGCIGQPNVGKSSLLNAIMGKKVVSVSRTPGHTKHFQTIFLTQNVRLCDCPGLVFPAKIPREMQALIGNFPIAQLRDPYSTIRYVAERLDLPKLLKIPHPEGDDTWSAMDICEGWAKKRGYFTARVARLDAYRAANNILRMALEGKICLNLQPPNYVESEWLAHEDAKLVQWVKAITAEEKNVYVPPSTDDELSPDEDDDSKQSGDDEEGEDDEGEDEDSVQIHANKFSALNVTD